MVHSRLFSIAVLSVILCVVEAEIFQRVRDNTTGIEERVLINTRRRFDSDKTSSSVIKSSPRDELNFDSSKDEESATSDEKSKKKEDKNTSKRKCQPCPAELKQSWRQPDIRWICGAYQRARRSFKSLCMMQYRNCQDGTMFVKIHSHRCRDDASGADPGLRHGTHLLYDYRVNGDGESGSKDESEADSSGSYTFEKRSRDE